MSSVAEERTYRTVSAQLAVRDADSVWEYGNAKYNHRHGSGQMAAEYGIWFENQGPWDWFVTRTYSPENLSNGFTKAGTKTCRAMFRDMLERSGAKRVVCVFERQQRGDHHLHALLGGCRGINGRDEESRDWKIYGISRWRIFRGTGAGAYLAKYLGKDMTELYIGMDGPYETFEDVKGMKV